jgi:hypothetical protein
VIIIATNILALLGLRRTHRKIEHGLHGAMLRKRVAMDRRLVRSKSSSALPISLAWISICISGTIITTCGFIFTWTPYAITLFASAFSGKHETIPVLVTFFCACFAKSSAIWIPLLYVSTSTQLRFRFNSTKRLRREPNSTRHVQQRVHKPTVLDSMDGSLLVRTDDAISGNNKHSTIKTYIASVQLSDLDRCQSLLSCSVHSNDCAINQ